MEKCPRNQLNDRENWYLSNFKPLLNILMSASADPRVPEGRKEGKKYKRDENNIFTI